MSNHKCLNSFFYTFIGSNRNCRWLREQTRLKAERPVSDINRLHLLYGYPGKVWIPLASARHEPRYHQSFVAKKKVLVEVLVAEFRCSTANE